MNDKAAIPGAPPVEPILPPRRGDHVLEMLAEKAGARFTSSTVYAAPVERDGVTVIPVASVHLAFGGGGGGDAQHEQEGEGGGVFGGATPVGYIELKNGRSRFVPVVHPARMVVIIGLIGLAIFGAIASQPRPRPRRPRPRRRRRR